MGAAGHRVGGQAGCPVGEQATWRLTPVVWCSPEWSSGLSCQAQQGMGVPSMINRVPGSRSSAVEAFSAGAAAIGGVWANRTPETVGWEIANGSARDSCPRLWRRLARTSRMLRWGPSLRDPAAGGSPPVAAWIFWHRSCIRA